ADLLECIGESRYLVTNNWPDEAAHCRIIEAEADTVLYCDIGYYSEVIDQEQVCTPCSPGYYNDNYGRTECDPCPLSTYTDQSASLTCSKCMDKSAEYYQDEEGQASCKKCASFSEQKGNGSSADDCGCKAGYFFDAAGSCVKCHDGGICLGGWVVPYAQAGFWQSEDSQDLRFESCPMAEQGCLGGVYNESSGVVEAAAVCAETRLKEALISNQRTWRCEDATEGDVDQKLEDVAL
ncbi:hypothetical protein CYMTET_33920, partial [Cymbomonas tetramitiformis]